MSPRAYGALVVSALACFSGSVASHAQERSPHDVIGGRDSSVLGSRIVAAPMVFEPNHGQAGPSVTFVARGQGYRVELAGHTAHVGLVSGSAARPEMLTMQVVGGMPGAPVRALDRQPGRSSYFIGADSARHLQDVPHFGRVEVERVYPGIDLAFYGNQQRLEYDFIVSPGGEPSRIRLAFSGHDTMTLSPDGDLVFRWGARELRQPRPVLYQLPGRDPVQGRFVVEANGSVSFDVPEWDRTRTLVIDPTIVFSSYFGGSGIDNARAVAVDPTGNIYLAGETYSANFPTANPLQPSSGGATDAFVMKLDATGTTILYSTYLGGTSSENATGIAVDAAGSAYVVGRTTSSTFPRVGTGTGLATCLFGAFITKLTPTGNGLSYSGCIPGTDEGVGIAVDGTGRAYVTGRLFGNTLPLVNAAQTTPSDIFVGRLNPGGTAWQYLTYLGGASVAGQFRNSYSAGLALNAAGEVCVTGRTNADNFPVLGALQPLRGSTDQYNDDAFVTKYSATGSVVFSTYLGGTGLDRGNAVAIDAAGSCHVTGSAGAGLPLVNAALGFRGGFSDAFVTVYNPAGTAYRYSTYLGGSLEEGSNGIAIDPSGSAHIAGSTSSSDFVPLNPLQPGLVDIGGVRGSTTGGASFTTSGLAGVTVTALAISPTNAQLHYAGTTNGIYRSTNGGTTWTRADSGLPYTRVSSLAIAPNNACVIYAGIETDLTNSEIPPTITIRNTYAVLALSTDCGATWNVPAGGPAGKEVKSLAFSGGTNPALYLSLTTNNASSGCCFPQPGVSRWYNGINTTYIFADSSSDTNYVMAADPVSACIGYAGGFSGLVRWSSSCDAPNWAPFGAPLNGPVTALATHSTSPGMLLAGTGTGTIYRKLSFGAPWVPIITVRGSINSIVFQPGNPLIAYAAGGGGTLYRTTDAGLTWTAWSTIGPATAALAVTAANQNVVLAGGRTGTDAFYARFSAAGLLLDSTWLGGPTADVARGIALHPTGDVVIVGTTGSGAFPVTAGVIGPNPIGLVDGFVARLGPTAACTYGINPLAAAIPTGGGAGTVNVTSQPGCAWTASSNAGFITVTAGASGFGNGAVSYSVVANTGGLQRQGTITIAGQTFTVTQSGAATPTITLSPAVLPGAVITRPFPVTAITQSGGTNPATFTVTSGSLPPGLGLTSTGTLSGTPTALGTFGFTITATDANGFTGARAYSIAVVSPTMQPPVLPGGTVGITYPTTTMSVTSVTPPVTFLIVSGALPSGLTLTVAGVLSGTPTVAGTFDFRIAGTDSTAFTVARDYTITIAPAPAPGSLRDLAIDFGPATGLWLAANQTAASAQWRLLHGLSPTALTSGDLDGNGRSDVILTFPGLGVWVYFNDSSWSQIHGVDAVEMAAGDLDGNGMDDLVLSFASYGIWVRYNNSTWVQRHGFPSRGMAIGNVDGDAGGRADLVVNFAGYGVWLFTNNSSWSQLHGFNAAEMRLGDLDGNGRRDLVVSFTGYGVWIRWDSGAWTQLHGLNSAGLVIGNIDGDAGQQEDVIISFPGYGVWTWKNRATWTKIHGLNATLFGATDVDASGRADVILSFSGYGLWLWRNDGDYVQLHGLSPELVATGRVDTN